MFQKVDYPFLFAAFAGFPAGVARWFLGYHDDGVYAGLWVQGILILRAGLRVVLPARVDGVLNCRGSLLPQPAHPATGEEWSDTLNANLTTAFHLLRAAASRVKRSSTT